MIVYKYHDIVEDLKHRIAIGRYDDGFPSVRALSMEYQVSSRTVGKAFRILRQLGAIRTRRSGTRINLAHQPRTRTRIVVLLSSASLMRLSADRFSGALLQQVKAAGCTPLALSPPGPESESRRKFLDDNSVDGYIFLGMFDRELAREMQRRGIPFIGANRMPGSYRLNWVDWDHRAEFNATVAHLVAAGYRRLALFHYLFPGMLEHWRLIYNDFLAESREFQLRNPDLELFVPEHLWDCDEFIDFQLRQSHLPQVVIRIGETVDDLVCAMERRGLRPGRDWRILLARFAAGSDEIWANTLWNLFLRVLRNPFAPPRQIVPTPKMEFILL